MRFTDGCLILAIPLALAFVAGQAEAQTTTTPDTARLREWFQSVDRKGDGRINREEFHQWAVERFFFLDKDRKGYLSVEELRGVVGPEAFKVANRKGDGKLTLQEFVNAVFQDFEAADLDKDGTLTFEEVEAYVRRTHR
jgi:Ca2+-binding EF-hand superfamily protein